MSNELDVQNEWEENAHAQTVFVVVFKENLNASRPSHIQRFVLATGETTVTQQVSHRTIKCQSRSRSYSTIGEGGDSTISSPGRSPKQPLPGIGLHDPLHGRQTCPEFIAFDKGVGQICPR